MRLVPVVPFLVLLGCPQAEPDTDDPKDVPTDGTTDAPDTDTPTDTGTPPVVTVGVTGLSWRLHPEIGSMVYASWTQDAEASVHVEYSFDTDIWLSSPSRTLPAGEHEQILVGIPFDTAAQWRVVIEATSQQFDGEDIQTAPLPEGMPTGVVTVSDPSAWVADSDYLLCSINERNGGWTGGSYWTFIMDRQARIVWAHLAPDNHWTLFAQVAVTGDHLLWDEATYWSDFGEGESSTVHKTWLDAEIEVVSTPGLHHAFVQLPDETLVWGSQAHGGWEALVQKTPGQPDETVLWTARDDWPGSGNYWGTESNGLFYVEETDSFLYSFYTNNSVVEVDHATGESLWWAGEVAGGYDFVPASSQYSWQHGISYTSSGTLLVSSEHREGGPTQTWLLEYEVDHDNQELDLVWSSNSNTRADTNGQAWRLSNGNTLHVVGSASEIREVTPDDVDVWRVDFDGTRLLGHGQYIADLYDLVSPAE